ncbi:hypothetical protein Igag_1125 [Ignisphaera aggregans DSM 17230]|uniref:Uncharacterized protein n=1 Tax=Ignisphaera aggregans (strain DSM 17230 / JCM 13409 / AQ1.S1) TaxID=583356 RepID=E0SNZ1_IGNAA|nr:hypothetical protein Igag_1125 [Ignisphaera aggregans DSM 17230]
MEIGDYEKSHVVRICREKCLEQGYYGDTLSYCIEKCIEDIRGLSK